ncbi:hypothetical protein LSH36_641g01037 [Paralvinella palmiformis]|uniref:Replication protein A subunit n=1 Tax=Paralvinella palmiformis TaxID=53620 RepID=A0AAD9J412_9ANNE|nr:hypothetical protein LSH36_641g01037 [Paralvinella palmiformis]
MSYELTTGAIEQIMTGEAVVKPVLQVLGSKMIAGSGGADRYRLLLSDGKYSHSSAMLATQLNNLVINGEMETFTVIQLEKYICNTIQPGRRVMILLEVTIIASGATVGKKIGNPQQFKAGQTSNEQAQSENKPVVQQPVQNSRTPLSSNMNNGPATPHRGLSSGMKVSQNAPNTPGGTPGKVHPISSLTPYQNRWCIKARVTNKSAVRTWSNSRGEGKLFNMTLLDDSGEIRATAFKNEVDKFYDMIEINKVYFIRKATLKTADKRYSSINNDYEMTFNQETEMIPSDDDKSLPSLSYNFIPINELEKHDSGSVIDVIGVVKHVADLSSVIGRQSNKEVKKRDVQLVDENKVLVRLTLWGNDAETFDGSSNPVLVVKGCRLSDWGGRTLSALASSQISINPDIPEAHRLRGWYDTAGHSADYSEFRSDGQGPSGSGFSTNWKSFADIKGMAVSENKAEYFTTKGTIIFLRKENCMYQACPQPDCNKKVIDQSNGFFRCEKCAKEYPNYKWRLILSANLADYSDNQWVTCFQDTAEAILGKSGEELGQLRDQDENAFDRIFTEATFKSYVFKMRAKVEPYNDEARLKTICMSATPVNFVDYSKKLITDIEAMLAA